MLGFMRLVDTKSRDVYVDPFAISAVLPAGKSDSKATHVLVDGFLVENIFTSAADLVERIARYREDWPVMIKSSDPEVPAADLASVVEAEAVSEIDPPLESTADFDASEKPEIHIAPPDDVGMGPQEN